VTDVANHTLYPALKEGDGMTTRMKKSSKALARATGTLVARVERILTSDIGKGATFEDAIDASKGLRRTGWAHLYLIHDGDEFRCPVEYRPPTGNDESTLRQHLNNVLKSAGLTGEIEIFTMIRSDSGWYGADSLEQLIGDPSLPLRARKTIERELLKVKDRLTRAT